MSEEVDPQLQSKDADQKALEKSAKIEKQRQEVLNNAASGNIFDDRSRVAYLLNNSVEARNSDKELVWLYWETFEKDLFGGKLIVRETFKKLTAPNSIIRLRAKIQNEYKLFQANDKVKRHRGVLEAEKKQQAIEDKPINLPFYNVYIDESGKTQKYISVGSLWLSAVDRAGSSIRLKEWKAIRNIDYEFHFKDVTPHRLENYKAFFLEFLTLNTSAGFKFNFVNNSGLNKSIITDLTFHLLNDGIKHENESGRAPLPRMLQAFIDDEQIGSDQIKIANIKERLLGQNIIGLQIGTIDTVSSTNNVFLQITDLFIASVNRKLHENVKNHKDELADYILGLIDFDISSVQMENSEVDNCTVFNLTYKKDSSSYLEE